MTPNFKLFILLLTSVVLVIYLTACAAHHEVNDCPKGWHRYQGEQGVTCSSAAASWDQENLKRNDRGCPSSVFVAPNGADLVQCL